MCQGNSDPCESNINSTAIINVSRRDLVRLRDHLSYLESSLMEMGLIQGPDQKKLSKLARDAGRTAFLFDSLFGDQIRSVVGECAAVPVLSAEEKLRDALQAEQITLQVGKPTLEQMESIIDAIRRIEAEVQGPAPLAEVRARAEEDGISPEKLDEILRKLKRAGALAESEGALRLI